MMIKYMIENKEKFNQYMNEISSYKTRNCNSYNYHKKTYSTDKNISISKYDDNKSVLKTFSNYDENIGYKNSYMDKDNNLNKNTISNLKFKLGDSLSIKNDGLSSYLRNKNSNKNDKRKLSVVLKVHRDSIDVNHKYMTPFKKRRFTNLCESNKNNEIQSNRSDYKTMNNNFSND